MKYKQLFIAISFFYLLSSCTKSGSGPSSDGQIKLTAGLVAYFPFSGSFKDVSGNNFNLTDSGSMSFGTDTAGVSQSAANFNGVGQLLYIKDAGKLYRPKTTISFLFNTADFGGRQAFFSRCNYENAHGFQMNGGLESNGSAGVAFGNPSLGCDASLSESNTISLLSPQVSTGQWHSYIAVFSEGTLNLYIDGRLIASKTANFQEPNNCSDARFTIGSWWSQDANFFKGRIDEFRIYDRALNKSEIAYLSAL